MDHVQPLFGDSRTILPDLEAQSFDCIVTDPPYGLTDLPSSKVADTVARWVTDDPWFVPTGRGWMGNHWDRFVPPPGLWAECLRVLKPGGYMVVFAGTRTVDLMGLSIRLAGFEVCDVLAWLYSTGMPKVGDQGKAAERKGLPDPQRWAGLSTTLKPALEPVVLARRPLDGTVLANLERHGTGALQVGACRVPINGERPALASAKRERDGIYSGGAGGSARVGASTEGRWPTNVLVSHGDDCRPTGDMLFLAGDGRAGKQETFGRRSRFGDVGAGSGDPQPNSRVVGNEHLEVWDCEPGCPVGEIGVEKARIYPRIRHEPKVKGRLQREGIAHTTVKPVPLMEWLIRLVCPPGGSLLDPFMGSGSTLEAAAGIAGSAVGIEQDEAHRPAIEMRLARTVA